VHQYNNTDILRCFSLIVATKLCCARYSAVCSSAFILWFCVGPAVSAVWALLQWTVSHTSILCRTALYIFLLDIFAVSAANSQQRCLPPRPISTPAAQLHTKHCCWQSNQQLQFLTAFPVGWHFAVHVLVQMSHSADWHSEIVVQSVKNVRQLSWYSNCAVLWDENCHGFVSQQGQKIV